MKCLGCNDATGEYSWFLGNQEFQEIGKKYVLEKCFCTVCFLSLSMTNLDELVFQYWKSQQQQPVTKPLYYIWHPLVECQVVSREFMSNLGQAIQYIWRSNVLKPTKGATKEQIIEDLEKAIRFIEFEIERIRSENE